MSSRDDLITALSSNLQPVKPTPNIDLLALSWLVLSSIYVIAMTHLLGPVRANAFTQLASEPRFLLETLSGVAAITATTIAAFRTAVPGALAARLTSAGIALMVFWLAWYVLGLASPSLEPSMLGKRAHCLWETFVYALPPVVVAFLLIRRLYPLQPLQTVMALGLASGMLPALYMQIACMYAPAHILQFHILPGLMVVVVAALLAWGSRYARCSSSNSNISSSS